jgi:hypothetical protein
VSQRCHQSLERCYSIAAAIHAIRQNHHPTLRHPDREAIGNELQQALVTLIDLALIGKHAGTSSAPTSARCAYSSTT